MSTSDKICKDSVSKSDEEEEDDVCCEVNDMLQKLSTADKDVVLSVCANCGKEDSNLKACTACKLVKYCNRECQIAHRPQHIIKKSVEDVLLSYMMKNYSSSLHQNMEIVQFVSYVFLYFIRDGNIMHAVEKQYVVDVIMRLFMITEAIKLILSNKTSVHFAELWLLNQTRRY